MTCANVFAFAVQTSAAIGCSGHSPRGVVADVLVYWADVPDNCL